MRFPCWSPPRMLIFYGLQLGLDQKSSKNRGLGCFCDTPARMNPKELETYLASKETNKEINRQVGTHADIYPQKRKRYKQPSNSKMAESRKPASKSNHKVKALLKLITTPQTKQTDLIQKIKHVQMQDMIQQSRHNRIANKNATNQLPQTINSKRV